MGKTETIKRRAVYVYLPAEEMAERWKQRAKRSRSSISKFVVERVEDSLRKEGDEDQPKRIELIKQLKELKAENEKLGRDNEILRKAYERLDSEVKRYRAKPFLDEGFKGVRKYDRKLVELLRRGRVVSSDEILEELGIDHSETDLVKAVNRQLENLEAYGLVNATARGWQWTS
jgi:hypothetical protein